MKTNRSSNDYTTSQLRRALEIREKIDELDQELRSIFGPETAAPRAASGGRRGPRRMSLAVRRKIARAQKARWASRKEGGNEENGQARPRRRLSSRARAKLAAAARERWARARAEGKTRL